MMVIKQLENDLLKVDLLSNGSAKIMDKKSGQLWEMSAVTLQEEGAIDEGHVWMRHQRTVCEQYPGRMEVIEEGSYFRYTLFGRQCLRKGSFLCDVFLEDQWLVFRILDIEEKLESLAFPPPIQCESLVLPVGEGMWIRKPLDKRFFWPTFCDAYTMRWLGGLVGEKGWMAIIDEGCADSGVMAAELSAFPAWMKSLGSWQGIKSVRYTFSNDFGYVSLAKIFRNWAKEKGLYKSLLEKMSENPATKNLHGSRDVYFRQAKTSMRPKQLEDALVPMTGDLTRRLHKIEVNYTHKETLQMIQELPGLGINKALIQIGGWLQDGYDGRYPDVWPPDEKIGHIEDLKEIMRVSDPFTVGLHDNYQDMYEHSPSFPNGLNVRKNETYLTGGIWDKRQCYIINSRNSIQYQKRNWENISQLKPRFIYIDTVLASQLYESFEHGNTLTREQDMLYKTKLLSFYKEHGIVLGTETGADYGMPYVDWLAANHGHTVGTTIPLWSLVYHDAVFCGCNTPSLYRFSRNNIEDPWWLKFMVWGYMLHIWIDGKQDWQEQKSFLKETLFVDEWHQKIGTEEMINHRYVTKDGTVEESVFESGRSIIVNFGKEKQKVGKDIINPGDFLIKE